MTRVRGVVGGEIEGRNVSHVKAPKAEPTPYKIDPGRASTIGTSVYFHKGPIQTPGGYSNPVGPTPNTVCGVGAGRTVMKAGSQSTTKAPVPMQGPRRDLFK
jgi:hypothetical protein